MPTLLQRYSLLKVTSVVVNLPFSVLSKKRLKKVKLLENLLITGKPSTVTLNWTYLMPFTKTLTDGDTLSKSTLTSLVLNNGKRSVEKSPLSFVKEVFSVINIFLLWMDIRLVSSMNLNGLFTTITSPTLLISSMPIKWTALFIFMYNLKFVLSVFKREPEMKKRTPFNLLTLRIFTNVMKIGWLLNKWPLMETFLF